MTSGLAPSVQAQPIAFVGPMVGLGLLMVLAGFIPETTKRLGVDFDRSTWPHGASGPAMPHGAIFAAPDLSGTH